MALPRAFLLVALAFVTLAGGLASRPAEGLLWTNARTSGTVAWDANGVAGFVGSFLATRTGTGNQVSGMYGWHVSGSTCTGSDNEHKTNYLMVQAMWESGDSTSMTVGGTATVSQTYWVLDTADNSCTEGPPSWTAAGTVTTSDPAQGDTGGNAGTEVAMTYPAHVSPGGYTNGQEGDPAPLSMSPVSWTVDPDDSSTWTFRISVSIDAKLDAGGVEIVVNQCRLTEMVTLVMSL